GLGRRQPLLAACLALLLLSLIGIPVTGGFFAKFYVFSAAINANLVGLTIIGVLNSAVAAYYYLRLIVLMYMRDETTAQVPAAPVPMALALLLTVSVRITLYLRVFPARNPELANRGPCDLPHA